ncbi:hypothetical protein ACPF8X_44930 [Streptomyces sp. G35A]
MAKPINRCRTRLLARRLEALLDYALAVGIGVGLADLLVAWWSS